MHVDANGKRAIADMSRAGELAAAYEAAGFEALWTSELDHDPFLPLLLASATTRRILLGTAVAIAFARSPMTLAYTAWDLQSHSGGRFILGLGTQVRAHITRRFSMPWSRPAARMREYVGALHGIWDAWEQGGQLRFEGEFYSHTLMPPHFNPGPTGYGRPRVFLAAVNQRMVEVAGAIADGLVLHSFTSPSYTRDVVQPALESGFGERGGAPPGFELALSVLVATGRTPNEQAAARAATRAQVAFYASTPAYRSVMAHHGWETVHEELHALSRRGQWNSMGKLINDEMLDTFAICATPERVLATARERYEGLVDRINFSLAHDPGDGLDRLLLSGSGA